jgi:hypothetical protein
MTTSRSEQMRRRAARTMQLADVLKAKDRPQAQSIGLRLQSAAKLRLMATDRRHEQEPVKGDKEASPR